MPIRFRCAYCNQLLGIARRKAGTVVRCPNCAGQVVVPGSDEEGVDEPGEDAPAAPEKVAAKPEKASPRETVPSAPPEPSGGKPAQAPAKPGEPLFERSDFDKLLNTAAGDKPAEPVAQQAGTVQSSVNEAGINVERVGANEAIPTLEPMAPIPGIWLSPAKATLLSVLAVLALTVAFVAGLLVGLSIGRGTREASLAQPHPHQAAR